MKINYSKVKTKESGFTLIELMIVVGIIGILVAIAAPNFSRYQSKARQSEAKIALSAIYGGEKAFYSEYSSYIAGMDAIGYSPEGQKRFYNVGWAGVTTAAPAGYGGGVPTVANYTEELNTFVCTAETNTLAAAVAVNSQTFVVNATGCIRTGAPETDRWTINEEKFIANYTINL
jgi:prepilin-type N-terminal cleavage/methylation domain-containing protein